jgi:hypothetical protein
LAPPGYIYIYIAHVCGRGFMIGHPAATGAGRILGLSRHLGAGLFGY